MPLVWYHHYLEWRLYIINFRVSEPAQDVGLDISHRILRRLAPKGFLEEKWFNEVEEVHIQHILCKQLPGAINYKIDRIGSMEAMRKWSRVSGKAFSVVRKMSPVVINEQSVFYSKAECLLA